MWNSGIIIKQTCEQEKKKSFQNPALYIAIRNAEWKKSTTYYRNVNDGLAPESVTKISKHYFFVMVIIIINNFISSREVNCTTTTSWTFRTFFCFFGVNCARCDYEMWFFCCLLLLALILMQLDKCKRTHIFFGLIFYLVMRRLRIIFVCLSSPITVACARWWWRRRLPWYEEGC